MQYITIIGLFGICALGGNLALVPPIRNSIFEATPAPLPTLGQDFEEILSMVPLAPIHRLATRYLLNDEQFQAVVRICNSNDAYITQMRFRSQPEVMQLFNWVNAQILLSNSELQWEETEECLSIINTTPFWSNTVSGWKGFWNELLLYFPADMIRTHIQIKSAQNGIFVHFLQRLKDLKPVYDRVIAMPEAQRVKAALDAHDIDTVALDNSIRYTFEWQHPPTVAPPTNATVSVENPTTTTSAADLSTSTALPETSPATSIA